MSARPTRLQNPRAFLIECADQAAYVRKLSMRDRYKALLLGGNYPV